MVTIKNLDYDKVIANVTTVTKMKTDIKLAFLESLPTGYTEAHLTVTLSKGSVKAQVVITPLQGSDTAALRSIVQSEKAAVERAVITKVKAIPNVAQLIEAGKTLKDLSVFASDVVEFDTSDVRTTTTTLPEALTLDGIVANLGVHASLQPLMLALVAFLPAALML